MEGDEEYTEANAGASVTYPVQCSSLRKNGFVMLKNRPCRIMEMSTSKTGKHGHAKVHLVGLDIFTNKKYEDLCPSTHNIDVPNVNRSDFQLIDISDDGFATLMNDKGETRDDLRIPEGELGQKIREEFGKEDITVIVSNPSNRRLNTFLPTRRRLARNPSFVLERHKRKGLTDAF